MELPIYNCILNEDLNDETGVYAISFVESPANEVNFVALSQHTPQFLSKDTQKQILTGVVLRPDQLIYRENQQFGQHYIKFSEAEIEKIALKMMRTGVALHNTTHQHQKPLSGNYLVELWIVNNPENDKSNALGFKNLPKGTLMCSYKVENKSYWDSQVMTGNVKGFSLEGLFAQEIAMSNHSFNNSNMKKPQIKFNALQRLALSVLGVNLSDIDAIEEKDTTDSGDPFVIYTLATGQEVQVDADGLATIDGVQMQAGEHKLSDGNILVIDESGMFVEVKEASEQTTDPAEATAAQTLRKQNLAKERTKYLKRVKLEEETAGADAETVESLKAKIAELEQKLADLAGLAEEAKTEVQELKKKTPTAHPATPAKIEKVDLSKMSPTDRMAYTALSAMKRRNGK